RLPRGRGTGEVGAGGRTAVYWVTACSPGASAGSRGSGCHWEVSRLSRERQGVLHSPVGGLRATIGLTSVFRGTGLLCGEQALLPRKRISGLRCQFAEHAFVSTSVGLCEAGSDYK